MTLGVIRIREQPFGLWFSLKWNLRRYEMSYSDRILIVDAEEEFLNTTARFLEKKGYHCECSSDPAAGEENLSRGDFDLLIAGISTAGDYDLEFIRGIPRISEGLPVIIVTDYPSLSTVIQSIKLPVLAYLVRPIDNDELLEHVRDGVNYHKQFQNVFDTRQRLKDLSRDLENIERLMAKGHNIALHMSLENFVAISIRNMVCSLKNLKWLIDAKYKEYGDTEICEIFNCPRQKELIESIIDAINVLDKTRSSFKSKELGQLRKKLLSIAAK
jgi:ActR/RegA family two-component response regulator